MVCLLSIILLVLLGILGEELLNLYHVVGDENIALPSVTALVLKYYPVNAGHFALSLTPFMIIFAGLALISNKSNGQSQLFWFYYVATWLVAVMYFISFTIALGLPYHLLLASMVRTPLYYAVLLLDVFIVGVIIIVWIRRIRAKRV